MKHRNLLVLLCLLCSGCVESEFTLSEESRLPIWIACPKDCTPENVEVKITFYTLSKARIEVLSKKTKEKIIEYMGSNRWHPKTIKDGILEVGIIVEYPRYYIIDVNGISEVFEFREKGPVIYVSENPEIRAVLEESRKKQ